MKRYELAESAIGDIQDIWEFISEDSFDAADRVLEEFYETFARLSESPGMGRTRLDLTSREVLFWPVRSYLVIYQDSTPLRVVRVLHSKRDVKKLLKKR